MDDLVDRLRGLQKCYWQGDCHLYRPDKLGPEAADRITALQARVDELSVIRLQDALTLVTAHENAARWKAMAVKLAYKGNALVEATDQMIEDTQHIFAEMQLVRGRPYRGKHIGDELEAFRRSLSRFNEMKDG